MKKYEFLEHTADAKFQAFGKTMEEAFSNAAIAMTSLLTDVEKIKETEGKTISVNGKDLKSLLYNFLEELLFLLDSQFFILKKVSKIKIKKESDTYLLNAEVIGDKIQNYETHGDIKAVTYNEMFIKEEKNKVTVQVVLDQ